MQHPSPAVPPLAKFNNPARTATGDRRAVVPLIALRTLWFNTGTLCNIACSNCYIESSPRNDRLAYLRRAEALRFLHEARATTPEVEEIGFTGGEPFMNPDILGMIEDSLTGGYRVLVLTNAMQPMNRLKEPLLALHRRFPGRLTLRVSLDHHEQTHHEKIRGANTWAPAMAGLRWLAEQGIPLAVAGRMLWDDSEDALRHGYQRLFADLGVKVDAFDPAQLVLFPEMTPTADVPEISEHCWGILGKQPDSVMCATSRMVVQRKGAASASVVACTLLPYDPQFELGDTLAEAAAPVSLNHPFCAQFCVLGGASCAPQRS